MGPQNVGILMAADQGLFADAGLEVLVTHPDSPSHSLPYVANRTVEFGVSHLPQVVIAREEGTPVLAVGSLLPHPTASMIWLRKSKIGGLRGLKGKTVAIPGLPYQEALLQSVLKRVGLTVEDVKIDRVGYGLTQALERGRADAIFGGSWNVEGAVLEARGLRTVVRRVADLEVPAYDELVLIAREDLVSDDPRLVRKVLKAVARGTAAAVTHPGAALEVIARSGETDPAMGRSAWRAGLEATLPLLSKGGPISPDRAEGLADWMSDEGLTQEALPASVLLTNCYVSP